VGPVVKLLDGTVTVKRERSATAVLVSRPSDDSDLHGCMAHSSVARFAVKNPKSSHFVVILIYIYI
jgi:hypothetical protein